MSLLRQDYRIKKDPINVSKSWRWPGCLVLLLLLSACGPGANEKAGLLYEQSLPHARTMLVADDYNTALKEYSAAAGHINNLLAEYAGSTLATELSNGATHIAGFKLNDFTALGDELWSLAAAEQDILACATAFAMSNDIKEERGFNFIIIAEAHAAAGNIAKTTNLLAMASTAADAKTNQLSRAHAYMRIAEVYDAVGATDPANHAAAAAEQLALSTPAGDSRGIRSQIYSLAEAAMRHLAAGNQERGLELMWLSVDALKTKQSKEEYSMPVSSLADDFDEEGHFDCAMEILNNANRQDNSLSHVIRGMVKRKRTIDELTQLAEFAMTIQDEYDRDRTLSSLAAHYAALGHFMSASMLQAAMENEFCNDDESWIHTISGYATNQQINAAFKTVNLIHKEDDRAEALLVIATALADQGQRQYAANTIAYALNIALVQSPWLDYEIIGKVAATYAELGYPEQSKELLEQHTAGARALDRPWTKANALNDLASAQIQLDDLDAATELLFQARESLAKDSKSGLMFKQIAENMACAGQYTEAFNSAEMIEDDSRHKEDTYADLALLFAAVGKDKLTEQCVEKVTDDYDRARLLEDLVELHLDQDQPERALALADRMEKDYDRHDALTLTALHYAGQDDFSHALETMRLITNVSSQVSTLVDIATETTPCRPLRAEEMDVLSLLVADQYPMEKFWIQQGVERNKNDAIHPLDGEVVATP